MGMLRRFLGRLAFEEEKLGDQIEDNAERRDPGKVKERRQQQAQHDRINQRMFLNAAWHVEMAMQNDGVSPRIHNLLA